MTLQWTTVQPTEPGYYWAAYAGLETFTLIAVLPDGKIRSLEHGLERDLSIFDLYSWPVEIPPAPVRPQKDVKDAVSKPTQA